ncbi:YgfZ/GcvT domain-containing protein [Paenalcaligenes sp. Me131]|uniref:CAF17-like 4Fe-4S cluster assembly/insertion protein YgfZ n=1 Tax=Paenalcaligenes sp. Me131 TaxID=3392636 RepID=UPI003D2D438C
MSLPTFNSLVTLPHYVVLDATGPDALSFLQGQFSNDLQTLGNTQASFGVYCAANGRMLASALLWQNDAQTISLLVHQSLAEPLLKRLRMFVLRAKVTLSQRDATVYGAYADTPTAVTDTLAVLHPDEASVLVQAPSSADTPRWWMITSASPSVAPDTSIEAQQRWDAQTLQQGVAHIELATQDLFIPQTLNMELINAISFSKGCFPGQEVVARSHYRGTIRRRSALFSIAATEVDAEALLPAQDIFGTDVDNQPIGRIVNSALMSDRYYLLAEVLLDEWGSEQSYHLQRSNGPQLQRESLPYDITQQRDNKRPKL